MSVGPRADPRPSTAATATAKRDPSTVVDLASRRAHAAAVALPDVQKAWDELVAEAKAQSIGTAAHLLDAELLSLEGTTIVIGFANDFARGFWHDRRRADLERGLSERLAVTVRVRCVVQQPSGETSDDPMHRAALEIFRRPDRIMEIE